MQKTIKKTINPIKTNIIKKLTVIIALSIILGTLMIVSCAKEDSEGIGMASEKSGSRGSNEMITLVRHGNDPYKFDNMKNALDSILKYNPSFPITSIEANEKYLRFLPCSIEQDSVLESYSDVTFFDFPLDYELSDEGYYYHDPSVTDSNHTWQYCVVPINYEFNNNIQCEHIYDVFIPDLDDALGNYYLELEEKAYELAGYTDNSVPEDRSRTWTPSATITVYDDILGEYIPLANAKIIIKGKYGSKKGEATTDEHGYCTFNKSFLKSKKIQYFIKWETGRYNLRHGLLGQAWSDGPLQTSAWTYNISKNMSSNAKDYVYANVHRGAYKFFYGERFGVHSPCMSRKTHIGVIDANGTSYCTGLRMTGIYPDIVVKKSHSKDASKIVSTTLHEIAHQSHMLFLSRRLYIGVKRVVYESWASAVEWKLFNHFYEELGHTSTYTFHQDWQANMISNCTTSCYTPAFIDLMDTYNQSIASSSYPNDRISGYTISYIQDSILNSSYGLSSMYNSIKAHKIAGVTDAMIDDLFLLYWGQTFDWP